MTLPALWTPSETFGRVAGVRLDEVPRVTDVERICLRVAPCACGGTIRADTRNPTPAVQSHNRTACHLRWWARVEPDWQ